MTGCAPSAATATSWWHPEVGASPGAAGASGDRFTNTRIFLVSPLIRFAVFPLGMDYHLPHHLFPMVPHFRIRQLHDILLETEEYRDNATVVEGYFLHRTPPQHATVVELMSQPPR